MYGVVGFSGAYLEYRVGWVNCPVDWVFCRLAHDTDSVFCTYGILLTSIACWLVGCLLCLVFLFSFLLDRLISLVTPFGE
jgi:hypothetical protein